MIIETILGREILDSRGNPTVEAELILSDGIAVTASVPSGASTGEGEALELRDGDKSRFSGKGVLKAVQNVEGPIADILEGEMVIDQRGIDLSLIRKDGTPNKEVLGANAILAASMAVAKGAAAFLDMPLYRYLGGVNAHRLPVPMMNVLNGGSHADNNVDVQEFMIVPAGAGSFAESFRMGAEVYHSLKSLLKEKKLSTAIGDEGGFAPDLKEDEEALEYLVKAIEKAGYKPGTEVFLAIDTAASSLYDDETKTYRIGRPRRSEEVIALYDSWVGKYPFISIEDGVGEHDRDGWISLTKAIGSKVQLVADDYCVTNPALIRKAIKDGISNAMLIKPNQIGTVTETMEVIEITKRAGYGVVVSHRSGETEEPFIADLSVAVNADFIKTGAPCRMDRLCKYNQLLRIEEELGDSARFAGEDMLRRIGM